MKLRKLMQLLVLAAVPLVLALQVGTNAPDFDLKDQFDKEWSLANLNGQVVVVVAADKNSGNLMGPWYDSLKGKYTGKIQLLGLLDLHTVPSIGRGIAKSRIKSETQDPMMLDFNGSTGKAYEVSSDYPVVVVINKNGIVKSIQETKYTDSAFAQTSKAIDAALK